MNRAILIGGKRRKFDAGLNTIYLLDLNTLVSSVSLNCMHID